MEVCLKVGIYTLGCKVNTYESEYISSLFRNRGYTITSFDDDCDVYVINTCTVTNNSDKKDKKIINHVRNKDACVVVCGCFVESHKDYNFDGIDIVIGNHNKSNIVDLVEDYFINKKQIKLIDNNIMKVGFEDMAITTFESRTRAFVKIQDGCENYCSYCIIPFVRGRCRSKDKDKVIESVVSAGTLIFYSAPHDLNDTLDYLKSKLGENRRVAICKELTKLHETVIHTTLGQAYLDRPKGEFVIVVDKASANENALNGLTIEQHVEFYVDKGMSKMDAIKATAKDLGVGKNEVYKALL